MKKEKLSKIVCSVLTMTLLLLSACKKDTGPFKESSNPDENIRNVMVFAKEINEYTIEDMQQYTEQTQPLIFAQMTPENKSRIVQERIDYEIGFVSNPAKISMLEELKSMINPAVYTDQPNLDNIAAIETFVEGMIPEFGYETTRRITNSWGNAGSNVPTGWSSNDCSCSAKSDWCSGYGNCGTGGGCTKGNGCGTVFAYKCDGECTLGMRNMNYPATWGGYW